MSEYGVKYEAQDKKQNKYSGEISVKSRNEHEAMLKATNQLRNKIGRDAVIKVQVFER